MSERYAVYYTPPRDSFLRRFAAQWLGYDPATGAQARTAEAVGLDGAFLESLTDTPALYGFHATLKPPFRLAEDRSPAELEVAVAELSETFRVFSLPTLRIHRLGRFLALIPAQPEPRLDAIAGACVEQLDGFRAPLRPDELERRRGAGLSARQDVLLQAWGYPYVFEEFRFHMTLTRALEDDECAAAEGALTDALQPMLSPPPPFDALSLMRQPAEGQPFTEIARLPLSAQAE